MLSLSEMIEEVREIVDVYKWEYTVYENSFPDNSLQDSDYNQNIYGISVMPPQCEPLYLCFLSNGRMISYTNLKF